MYRVLFIAIALCLSLNQPIAAQRPNVLFIAIDDLNDWIGCLGGHPQALTPNIDRLAARGVLFTNAHCASPACNPSRAAVFSGRLPGVTGVWSNQSGSIDQLYPNAPMLSTVFSEAGYVSFGTGKLLHSGGKDLFDEYYSVEQRWSPLSKGAVRYTKDELPSKGTNNPVHLTKDQLGREVQLPLNRMPSDRRPNRNDGESFDWGPFDVPDSDFGDTKITDWAIKKLEEQRNQPLFLGVGYYRPHIPLWAPERFFARFKENPADLPKVHSNDLDDLSPMGKQWALEAVTAGSHATVAKHRQWRTAVEAYLACVTYIDEEVGRLLDALDRSPIRDNTIVCLWSDHGWHLGEKQHWGKWTGWERSTRVVMMMVPPENSKERFASAARCDQPVSLLDLYPTLTDLCDVDPKTELDGESLVRLLEAPNQKTNRTVVTSFDRGNASARDSRWRYVRYSDGSEELYDHQADKHEWHNLASSSKHAEVKRKLSAVVNNYFAKGSSGHIATVAGAGGKSNNGNSGKAQDINIGQTFGVEIGPDGALYVCEVENHRVFRVDLNNNQVTTVAGNGTKGYSGDGGLATAAQMNEPYEVRFDSAGNMFVVEMQNHIVRRIESETNVITTVAGTGTAGFSGDGGSATQAQLHRPHSIAIHDGDLFIADIGNHRVRRVDLATGIISTIAGNGEKRLPMPGKVLGKPMVGPRALYTTPNTLWIALREGHSVWKLDLGNGVLSHIAGSGKKGYEGDGGSAKLATFNGPKGIVVDRKQNVFVVDTENQAIRRIDSKNDRISTIAGNGKRGFDGDNGPGTKATMDRPHGICLDKRGAVYIGDTNNHRVRAVSP